MSLETERALAVSAVERASGLCQRVQADLVDEASMAKKDKSPVTVADFGAQAVVVHTLAAGLPDVPLVGEEDAQALRADDQAALRRRVVEQVGHELPGVNEATVLELIDRGTYDGGPKGRFWTLDPIDGTKGFLRLDQYAVALALIEDGEVVLGVLGCPNMPLSSDDESGERGCLFVAVRGEGTFMRSLRGGAEKSISVTSIHDPSKANFCESVESGHSSQDDAAQVAARLGITAEPHRIDSQCKYAAVARGDASIYLRLPTRVDYQEKIWDHAAGSIVVEEAGGQVSDAAGRPLDFSQGRTLAKNEGVVVSNGHVHEPVIEAVRAVLGL